MATINESALHYYFSSSIENILNYINPNDKILEIGSGDGSFLKLLNKHGFNNLYSIDRSQYFQDNILQYTKYNSTDLNYCRIPYDDSYFDIVFSFQVIEHIQNPWHFVNEIHRVLKPNKFLIISFPSSKDLFSKIKFLFSGNILGYNSHNNHYSFFSADIQKKLFNKYTLTKIYPGEYSLRDLSKLWFTIKLFKYKLSPISFFKGRLTYKKFKLPVFLSYKNVFIYKKKGYD